MLHTRQQVLHLRVSAKRLLEPGVNALPHPGQGLLFAPRSQAAVGGLQLAVLRDGVPKTIHALPQQRTDLQHLGMPARGVVRGVVGFAVLVEESPWPTVAGLVVGGLFAAPFAAYLTKHLKTKTLLVLVGTVISGISAYNLVKALH